MTYFIMEQLVIEDDPIHKTNYCSTTSKKRTELEKELIKCYGLDPLKNDAKIFSSGRNAISCLMSVLIKPKERNVFILGNEMFSCTKKGAKFIQENNYPDDLILEFVDVTNFDSIKELFVKYGNDIKLLFIESCTNPSGKMIDFDRIGELKVLSKNLVFCVDNTWCTCVLFNPFKYCADVVIESMTKYISGGMCLGGMIVGNKDIVDKTANWIRMYGQFIGSDHCQIYLTGLKTLPERIKFVSDATMEIANEMNKMNLQMMVPMLPSHPTFDLNKKFLSDAPGIILFCLPVSVNKMTPIADIIQNLPYLKFETSYGAAHSKIDPYTRITHSNYYNRKLTASKTKAIWFRISIGYETDTRSVLSDIKLIVEKVSKLKPVEMPVSQKKLDRQKKKSIESLTEMISSDVNTKDEF
jgi:cystathionine beta-lyase/cystathionine gamma-synthase